MVHAAAYISEMTTQSEGVRSGTCMVFACLYLIVGNFLRARRGADHPFMSALKTLCALLLHR
jgi:hypothetical protein